MIRAFLTKLSKCNVYSKKFSLPVKIVPKDRSPEHHLQFATSLFPHDTSNEVSGLGKPQTHVTSYKTWMEHLNVRNVAESIWT